MSFIQPGKVTVKGQRADKEQLRILARALELADRWDAPYKAKVALVEALIVESEARNLRNASADGFGSYGVLQGRAKWHSRRDLMDPAYQIGIFLGKGRGGKKWPKGFTGRGNAISLARRGMKSGDIAQAIEGSAYPHRYQQHQEEAMRIVRLWRRSQQRGKTRRTGGARGRAAGGSVDVPVLETATVDTFDEKAFVNAQKDRALAEFVAKRNPNSLLLKTGALSTEDVIPQDYMGEKTISESGTVKVEDGTGKRGGSSRPERRSPRARSSWKGQGLSPLRELFYDPQGGWDDGRKIAAIGGHSNHVHVAAGPKTIVRLGKRAQQMGLRVSEQDQFDGRPRGGHAPGSFHYRGQAIDVSGDAKKMAAFTRYLRRLYRLPK